MRDPKEIMRKQIEKLKVQNEALRTNDINTILDYIRTQADQLEKLFNYASEANGCEAVFLDAETEKIYGLKNMDRAWVVAGIIQRLEKENKTLTEGVEQALKSNEKLQKENEALKTRAAMSTAK